MLDRRRRKIRLLACLTILITASTLALFSPLPAYALDISTSAIRAPEVWNMGINGAGVTVAVIDSGISQNHPDFGDAILDSFTMGPAGPIRTIPPDDYDDHGTRVAGIIAGRGTVYRGVAWGASLVIIRLRAYDKIYLDEAIYWVRDHRNDYSPPIRVINISLSPPSEPLRGDGTKEYAKAVDDAIEAGIIVVAAAGNHGDQGYRSIATPGDAFNVITVGASDDNKTPNVEDDTLDELSSRGPTGDAGGGRPKPDVVAPGVNIMPTDASGGYSEENGTSFAAPHVSGTVALMLQANPNLTPAQVKAILRHTSRLNPHLSGLDVNQRGRGIIDAYAAVGYATTDPIYFGSQLYDSWNVETPSRNNEKLSFTVDPPDWDLGISITNVQYDGPTVNYEWVHRLAIPHIWIDSTRYWLGTAFGYLPQYLFSGPRIYEKGDGYVNMRALYKVGGVIVESVWEMDVSGIWLRLFFRGGSSWKTLMYIDVDAWDPTNWVYLPVSNETVKVEAKLWFPDFPVDIRDLGHTEYVEIWPVTADNPVMWILKHDYRGYNPDEALNGTYIYDQK